MNRSIKFKVYDKLLKKFIPYNSFLNFDSDEYIFQQFTGLQDSKKEDVFEGDIIRFKYIVGDFAWENMTDEEYKYSTKMQGRTFVGVVEWNVTMAGFNIVIGDKSVTHSYFPTFYCTNGKIIGNILEMELKNG